MRKLSLFIIPIVLYSCKSHIYQAPSSGMEGTIMAGEPFSVTPTTKFDRNDIVMFDFYGNDYQSPIKGARNQLVGWKQHWEKRLSRVIAVSGDSLQISKGEVYINGRPIPLPPKAKTEYEVRSKTTIDEFNDPSFQPPQTNRDTLIYTVSLSKEEAENYERRKPAILSVRKYFKQYVETDTEIIKACTKCHWTADEIGPLYIPSPGETITVDSVNFKIYHNIPGIHIGQNTIKERLYFMMGDNRHGSQDSRYIGYISHSKMYGVVK